MAAQRLVTRAEFSKQAGVSRAAVTKAATGALAATIRGKYIDIDHPDAIKYIKSKQQKTTSKPPKKAPPKKKAVKKPKVPTESKKPKAITEPVAESEEKSHYSQDDELKHALHLTLGEIIGAFGTDIQFERWVKAHKTIIETREKELKVAKIEGLLISRKLVEEGIVNQIDMAFKRLLTDGPATIVREASVKIKTGADNLECEEAVRERIASFIRPLKSNLKRALKNV